MTAPQPVILVADDFGISEGVNRAIVDLCKKGRLSAVTCMSLADSWEKGAPLLKACNVATGLHVTLTWLPPLVKELGPRHASEKTVILKSWARLLDKKLIEKEIRAQFEKFIKVWGAPPDFIDGHQHMHILPTVRDIVLALRDELAPKAWIRNVADISSITDNWKNVVRTVLGWRFRDLLKARNIPTNARMRGPYNPAPFPEAMERWCAQQGGSLLIYCHPGHPDAELARYDTFLEPRQKEYDFLNSDAFGAWLGKKIVLTGRP